MFQLLPDLQCDFFLSPEAGRIHVLTGDNGIGKTTFLKYQFQSLSGKKKSILSEQKPLEVFFDRPLKRFREILLEDSQNLDHELFLSFWEKGQLKQKEDRLLSQLSGGESQLLKIISQCSARSECYLIDEPGQYLDRDKKILIAEFFTLLVNRNSSILAVEHDTTWFPSGTSIHELHRPDGILREKSQWTI